MLVSGISMDTLRCVTSGTGGCNQGHRRSWYYDLCAREYILYTKVHDIWVIMGLDLKIFRIELKFPPSTCSLCQ